MTDPGVGGFNRLRYDVCSYARDLYESTSPMKYMLYPGWAENCNKCVFDKFWVKTDPEMVDTESELKNITRWASKCAQFKYNKNCPKSKFCTSTFDVTNPKIAPGELCPIITNNIKKMTVPGFESAETAFCAPVNSK
jgi:hypothetical protein